MALISICSIRPSIYHLMRGQVFNIDGNKIFTFGGAQSHDISAGVLDRSTPDFQKKRERLDQDGIFYRILKESWWEQELPSEEKMKEGLVNLQKVNFDVDYIITHCCSTKVQAIFAGKGVFKVDKEIDYFEDIREKCSYKKWYFGHYHDNRNVTEKDILLYDSIIKLGEKV